MGPGDLVTPPESVPLQEDTVVYTWTFQCSSFWAQILTKKAYETKRGTTLEGPGTELPLRCHVLAGCSDSKSRLLVIRGCCWFPVHARNIHSHARGYDPKATVQQPYRDLPKVLPRRPYNCPRPTSNLPLTTRTIICCWFLYHKPLHLLSGIYKTSMVLVVEGTPKA